MTTFAVLGAAALAVAGPDLVTVAESLRGRARPRRGSAWPLVSVVTAVHVGLGVAALVTGRGVS
jgi:hypothetical protein